MIHVVRKLLVDNNGYQQRVDADNTFLVMARQGAERPYVAIDLEGTLIDRHTEGIAREVYNVIVYITTTKISEGWSIQQAVKNTLDQYNGNVRIDGVDYIIDWITLEDVMTDAHELHDFYIVVMSFNVHVCV